MRRLAFAIAILLAATATGETLKTITIDRPAAGLTGIVVKAGVGDVEVAGDGGSDVAVRVDLTTRGGGFFGGRPTAREIDEIAIDAAVVDGELHLRLRPEHRSESHLSERWTVRVPATFAATVKLGVGNVTVLDLTGDVRAKLGVGDVRVEGRFASTGEVRATSGVGDATLRTPEGHTDGHGFISHSLRSHGAGNAAVEAEVGVGDITIRLR